ncbi:MAG: hypothetical protein AAFY34_09220 [Pseudomonadota bacterium]
MSDTAMFLKAFGRRAPTLAFKGDRGLLCRRYPSPRIAARAANWFNREGRECYFVGNSHLLPVDGRNVRKPSKEDIALAVGIWLDVDHTGWDPDVPWALRSVLDYDPAYIAFTGGGYQAHWRFDQPTADSAEAEAINHWLVITAAKKIDGVDLHCWTCEHLWRLPGTLNHRRGRRAVLVHADWSSKLPIAECDREIPPVRTRAVALDLNPDRIAHEMVQKLPIRARRMMLRCPDHLRKPDGTPDRSQHQFAFIQAAIEGETVTEDLLDTVAAVLLAPATSVETVSHCSYADTQGRKRRNPAAHVERQIGRWLASRELDGWT